MFIRKIVVFFKKKIRNQSIPEEKELTEIQVDDWVEKLIDRYMSTAGKNNCQ